MLENRRYIVYCTTFFFFLQVGEAWLFFIESYYSDYPVQQYS